MNRVAWTIVGALVLSACGQDATTDGTGGSSSGGSNDSGGTNAVGGTNGSGAFAGDTGSASGGTSSGGTSSGGSPSGGASGGGDRLACKRGVAYGHHSQADMAALSAGVSFWYNWAFVPDEDLADGSYFDLEVEYVPMIWGANVNLDAANRDIPAGAHSLLGFNEPNFGSQANMSAQAAADLWPELEDIADARGLDLVSPAVNFCGGDCQNTDPFDYLDDFFAACDGCRVDAIAMHIYVGCNPDGDNHAEWLINHVETYKTRFALPLWLTEFACDSAQNETEQLGFLEDAVEYLENEPRIARYAWFAGRADNVPHVDLLGADGELTALGQRYVELDQPAECQR